MTFVPLSLALRRKSDFAIETDPANKSLFTETPPAENVRKMTEILNHLLIIADDKRKTDLSKSPKPGTIGTIVYSSHLSSVKTARQSYGVGKATNFDQQDELARPVQTLESITHIFSIVVKVLFGYEFSEKPPQDLKALQIKRKEFALDKKAWEQIKSTFDGEKRSKVERAFNKADKILISREKYLQKIHCHRIALAALSVIALLGMLLAKRSWSYLGIVACTINVANVALMFTNYISSTETQAMLARQLKPLVNACRTESTSAVVKKATTSF